MLTLAIYAYDFLNMPAAQTAGQTLPDETSPVGKIHPFSKIALTFGTNIAIQDLELLKNVNIVCFMTGITIFNGLGVTAP